ncbi:Protein of uncharacterised function (DUF2560) [Klebsiella pneumoniae]|nr:Protein of uncharacterised function (DUF2560) [Klebsiella pneumoniae]SVZ59039.1 Protein of uncharacterised function (DUF2560) [Klebsiella pneumoniae]SWA11875.1 Protein of uncharacterised function (DUF2560) [Klebsiella pneumoniae]SWA15565.1 Protein of uncharacterised function (DUF2560) [Klebsiella pneumoniae]VUH72741.1 Protein of uncharacterised function (DUF2560) [Klebsiella pneumoniae]
MNIAIDSFYLSPVIRDEPSMAMSIDSLSVYLDGIEEKHMSEITAPEQIRLGIIKKVNYDTAAAKLAIDWVGDSYLKSQLFADSFDRVFTESEIVSKTRKAIQEATEALALFDAAAEQSS